MSVRIVGLNTATSLQDGDFIVIDNESNGTRKYSALNLGANVAGNIASSYSSSATYAIGQYCLYNNDIYKCTTTIVSPEAWNAAHWVQVTVGDQLYTKVDKVSGKGLSANDFTDTYKNKLDGIANGAEVNVQPDWNVIDSTSDAYIKNKPTDATSSSSGFMSANDKQKLDGIATGAEVNVQSNWSEADSSNDAYIQNKPTSDTTLTVNGGFADAKAVGDIFEDIKSGDEEYAIYHLGFYLDENGDLNQVDD